MPLAPTALPRPIALGFALAALPACDQPTADAPLVQLDPMDGLEPCGAEHTAMEDFAIAVLEQLEQPIPDDLSMRIRAGTREQVGEVCGEGQVCMQDDAQLSWAPQTDRGFIIRTLMSEISESSILPLRWGISIALSPPWVLQSGFDVPRVPMADYLHKPGSELSDAERYSAGLQVAFMLREYGAEPFVGAYADLSSDSSAAEVDAAFVRHFGRSLAEVDADFVDESEARCFIPLWECGPVHGPPLTVPFEFSGSLECSDPQVLGYSTDSGNHKPHRRFQIEIPASGDYIVEASGLVFGAYRCGPCSERTELVYFNGSVPGAHRRWLDAGVYTVAVPDHDERFGPLRLSIQPVG